jgi:transposase
MPTKCTVCNHPDVKLINKAIVDGISYRGIAKQYGLSLSAIKRHKDGHLYRKDPSKPGRPTKATPERLEKLIEGVRSGLTFEIASKRAGISYTTFKEWRKDPRLSAFAAEIKNAEADAEHELLQTIKAASHEKNQWQAAAWILERRYPERYGRIDRLKAELTGKDGDPIQVSRVASDEEVIAYIERINTRSGSQSS